MSTFKEFFKFEWVRFLCKRNLLVFGLLFVLALGLTQYGIFNYNDTLEEKECFQNFESKKVKTFFSYRLYANYGFRIASIPVPFNIFIFSSAPLSDMITYIDTSERLKICNPLQARGAFNVKKDYFTDFSGMMFFLGSLLALLFGFEMLLDMEYMKILASIAGQRTVFLNMVLARALLINMIFLVILVSSYLLIAVNGIFIPLDWALPVFLLLILVNGLFFFAFGTFLGTLRSKGTGLLIGLFGWVLLIIVIPMVLNTIVKYNANSIQSVYKMEFEKWKILKDFQITHYKKDGVFKSGESKTSNIENKIKMQRFRKNEFKDMMEKDEKMIQEMEKNVSLFHWLSSVFPTSNYLSTNYELSGNGYSGFIEFYRFALKIKMELMDKYVDIVFVQRKSIEKFEPVLNDGENLFPLKTRIPIAAALGVLLTFIYSSTLLKFGHKGYKKEIFRLPKKKDYHFDEPKHTLRAGELAAFTIEGDIFGRQMFNLFSGRASEIKKKGFDLKFTFESGDIVHKDKKSAFLYLPHLNIIPGFFKTGAFVSLLMGLARTGKDRKAEIVSKYDLKPLWNKAFNELEGTEPNRVFLAMLHMRAFEIYLIDDAIHDMPLKFAKELKDDLTDLAKEKKALVLFTTDQDYLEKRKKQHGHYFLLNNLWVTHLDELVKVKAGPDEGDS